MQFAALGRKLVWLSVEARVLSCCAGSIPSSAPLLLMSLQYQATGRWRRLLVGRKWPDDENENV